MRFVPNVTFCEKISANAKMIEEEPMLFNATPNFLQKNALKRPITDKFLRAVEELWGDPLPDSYSLDTRSHMLMRGWYPAIPGWHHDDVDRGENGQPDYDNLPTKRRTMFCCTLDAWDAPTNSMTEFVREPIDVPWPLPDDEPVYRYWDNHINNAEVETRRVQSGRIVRFTDSDFHRAVPAERSGWRWFARLSFDPGPRPDHSKIRRQVQVYLPVTNKGW